MWQSLIVSQNSRTGGILAGGYVIQSEVDRPKRDTPGWSKAHVGCYRVEHWLDDTRYIWSKTAGDFLIQVNEQNHLKLFIDVYLGTMHSTSGSRAAYQQISIIVIST